MLVKRIKTQRCLLVILICMLFVSNRINAVEPVVKWISGLGGANDEYVSSIVSDTLGNTYTVGYFRSDEISFGSIKLLNSNVGSAHLYIVKADSLGNVLWAKSTNNNEIVYGLAANLDSNGNLIFAGHFSSSTATFGATVLSNSSYNGAKMYISKIDSNGNFLWAKTPADNNSSSSIYGLSTDSKNNIFVTGHFQSSSLTFDNSTIYNNNSGMQDSYVVKIDKNGNYLWGRAIGGSNHDVGNALAVDKSDNVIVAGYFTSGTFYAGNTTLSNSYSGYQDMFLVKYDSTGVLKFAKSFGGTYNESIQSVAVDKNENIYLGGYFKSSSVNIGSSTINNPSSTYERYLLAKFDSNANVLWAKTATDCTNNCSVNSLTVDKFGGVYLTGYFQASQMKIDTIVLQNSVSGNQEAFLAKYDTYGGVCWAKNFVCFGNDYGKTITNDMKGNIYVAGNFSGNFIALNNSVLSNSNQATLNNFILRIKDVSEPVNLVGIYEWVPTSSFSTNGRYAATAFAIGSKAYVGLGQKAGSFKTYDMWEFDGSTNSWSQKASYPGNGAYASTSFTINDKAYVCLGADNYNVGQTDMWEYNPTSNVWTKKADFPGTGRYGAVSFVIGDTAFVATGSSGSTFFNDLYMYVQGSNTWTRMADFPGTARAHAVAFSLDNYGFIGTGYSSGNVYKDFWKYSKNTNSWTRIADINTVGRTGAICSVLNNKAFVVTGYDLSNELSSAQMYNSTQNIWENVRIINSTQPRHAAVSFVLNNRIYLGTGYNSGQLLADFTELKPCITTIESPVSVNDKFRIFPNPVKDNLSIEAVLQSDSKAYIMNLNGQIMGEISLLNSNMVDVSYLLKGVYFIKIMNSTGSYVSKFIKN